MRIGPTAARANVFHTQRPGARTIALPKLESCLAIVGREIQNSADAGDEWSGGTKLQRRIDGYRAELYAGASPQTLIDGEIEGIADVCQRFWRRCKWSWNDIAHKLCSGRRSITFPEFRAMDAVIGDEIQGAADVREVIWRGIAADGLDIPYAHRSFFGAVTLPKFVASCTIVGAEKYCPADIRSEAIRIVGNSRVVETIALLAWPNVADQICARARSV